MTIRNFLLQLTLIFALIISLTACEKDQVDPVSEEVTNETQLKSQADCEELLELYGNELEELGIDPETFCDEMEWEGNDDEWNSIDWEMNCDSVVAMYADELEAFGFDPETFCDDLDWAGYGSYEGEWGEFDCDSLVAIYADELEELGLDPETFCDDWNGEWDWDNYGDDWDDIDWTMDCDSLVAIYADQLEDWGIDPDTFCDEWGNGDDDWDDIDWTIDCDSLVAIYADQLEDWGIDPDTFCDEWGNHDDDWDDIDWTMDCDSLVTIYADQLEDWGLDPDTFCDEWDWDYGDNICCIVTTNCGVLAYAEEVEVVAENDQITVYNEAGEVLDSIECEDDSVEVECHGG